MCRSKINLFLPMSFCILLSSAFAYAQVGQETITLGRVTDNPKKHHKKYQPIASYLARELAGMGIKEGKVLFAKDNRQMIQYLKEGKIDIVTETPFSALLYIEKADAKPILRRWKQGIPFYRTNIFVRKDSGIGALKDLVGKVIGFEDPGSTSGYLLPKSALLKAGIGVVELKEAGQKPPPDKVGYVFAREENNIPHWVYRGIVDAGVLSSEEYERPKVMPLEIRDSCKVIFETESVPRNLILVREGMDPRLVEAIKKALKGMRSTEEGRELMRGMEKTFDFDELPDGPEGTIKKFKERFALAREDIDKNYEDKH